MIGTLHQEIYAIQVDTFSLSSSSDVENRMFLTDASLYKIVLDDLKPLFTYTGQLLKVYASQRTITTLDDSFYCATYDFLMQYNMRTKESKEFPYLDGGYNNIPSITAVGGQIFITDMSLTTKRTYLFDVDTTLMTRIPHEDHREYTKNCFLCECEDKLLIVPANYVNDDNKDNRKPEEMNITAFQINRRPLQEKTVAITNQPVLDTVFYESSDPEFYLRGLFQDVWLYKNGSYQAYPTYVGDGTEWKATMNYEK